MSGTDATNEPSAGDRTPGGRAYDWLDERFDLDPLVEFARHKTVPVGAHATMWYYLGGLSLFLFLVQIATGILLLMHYEAGEASSYESLKRIVTQVPFGWLVRGVHCWSAHLMVACVILHMFSVYFTKAYRKPRELTWLSGMALLGITLGFGFSGYLLPWNELAFFATAVGTDVLKAIPKVGPWLLEVARGGDEVSTHTLYRFFAIHVSLLPLVGFGLIGIHLLFIQRQGMAEPLPEGPGRPPHQLRRMPFFPSFALRDLLLWIVVLNVIALLAVLLPHGPGIPGFEWELGQKADPLKPAYPGIKPEWYFLWVFQLLREMPPHVLGLEGPQVCLIVSGIVLLVWTIVPFLDRRSSRGEPSPRFTDLGVAAVYFVLYLSLKGWDIADPIAAGATLGLGAVVTIGRLVRVRGGSFALGGLALLIPLLDGLVGLGYFKASVISTGALALVLAVWAFGSRGRGAAAVLALTSILAAPAALADEPSLEDILGDDSVSSLLDEAGPETRARFLELSLPTQRLVHRAITDIELLSSAKQLRDFLSLGLSEERLDLLLTDNCVLCHTNPDLLDPRTDDDKLIRLGRAEGDPYRHLDLHAVADDVHLARGLMCSGCHGGDPADFEMTKAIAERWPSRDARRADRSWVPAFCARCHADAGLMRRYDPSLPVDQLLKYRESRHGQLLLGEAKDSRAAQCVSCHGGHGILGPESPRSRVHPLRVAETCASCHADPEHMKGFTLPDGSPLPTDQVERWSKSVHGRAMLERGDLGAPTCNDCHGNHAAMPPAIAHVSQVCRTCHVHNGELFDGSRHKAAFEKNGWPECATCHGHHSIEKPTDALLGPGSTSICDACHTENATPDCAIAVAEALGQITGVKELRTRVFRLIDEAEALGMPVEDLRFQQAGMEDAIVEMRARIHTFDPAAFATLGKTARQRGEHLEAQARERAKDYGYRRTGLLISTLIITAFAALLYLKIRQVDRDAQW